MDVNGTRFHHLLNADDWGLDGSPSSGDGHLEWDPGDGSLRLNQQIFQFRAPSGTAIPRPEDRRGAARDLHGNWYWIGKQHDALLHCPLDRDARDFWSQTPEPCPAEQAGDFQPARSKHMAKLTLRGLCITGNHLLVVGTLAPHPGLLVFDLNAGGPPSHFPWPTDLEFSPFDLTAAPHGEVWVLDTKTPGNRLWLLDSGMRVVALGNAPAPAPTQLAGAFTPISGATPELPGATKTPISTDQALTLPGDHLISVEALSDGSMLLLESDPAQRYSRVHWLHCDTGRDSVDLDALLFGTDIAQTSGWPGVLGHDLAWTCDDTGEHLHVVAAQGNQSFAFSLVRAIVDGRPVLRLALETRYLPMSGFSGKALVASADKIHYDQDSTWLPLVEQPRPRYAIEGTLETRELDGREQDCTWHRVLFDGMIPTGAEVQVATRANNEPALLAQQPWQIQPAAYLRRTGSELPYHQGAFATDCPGSGTWELLIQAMRGRWLQLRLTLKGSGRNTPRIRSLRIYYPRFSYLEHYLPAIYREDQISASFLERFLANTEGLLTYWEDRVALAQLLFDARSCPTDYLEWLAGWLGMVLDPDWEEWRRRIFLRYAMSLYRQRGTPWGLIRAIRLATDSCVEERLFTEDPSLNGRGIRVFEEFLRRNAPGVVFGDPTDATGPGVTSTLSDWTPPDGGARLHQDYRRFALECHGSLQNIAAAWGRTGLTNLQQLQMPPVLPSHPEEAADWRQFVETRIDFTYAIADCTDRVAWQDFLARRYRHFSAYSKAYQNPTGKRFSAITLPDVMPADGVPLTDWIGFVSVALPARRLAHRFKVLVPIDLDVDSEARGDYLNRIRRVIEIEQPAHTEYELADYLALFRVGEARVGLDTLVSVRSQPPQIVIGNGYLGRGLLSAVHPWNLTDRRVISGAGACIEQ